jgi:hypothetical protein
LLGCLSWGFYGGGKVEEVVVLGDVGREVHASCVPSWRRREKKRKLWYRVVGLRGRWAGSGQVKDGLLFFSPFFSEFFSSSFCIILLGNKRERGSKEISKHILKQFKFPKTFLLL